MTSTVQSDTNLMLRVAQRDGDALAELYDLYSPRVFGLCLRIVSEKQLAEDLLQEVFVRVWERAELFQQARGNVNAWVMGITRNLCIDQLRRQQARPQAAEPAADSASGGGGMPFEETLPDLNSSVPELAAEHERAALVRRAMARLNQEQQLVIELSYFRGLTRREIAQRLSWPEGTVHTRARLALQNLRQQLNEMGLSPSDLE
jgi:RNA polymerase sigma-70 factor, ECF subfamily